MSLFCRAVLGMLLSLTCLAGAADWPTWGGSPARTMTSGETGLPELIASGTKNAGTAVIDPASGKNLLWTADLGLETCGSPVVAGGKVLIGTNNGMQPDPRYIGVRGVLKCFDEATGAFIWQLNLSKGVHDGGYGLCGVPTVEGNRVYLVTNRGEVMCLDLNGMSDGNDGPFTDEAHCVAGKRKTPIKPEKTDADIIWVADMLEIPGTRPHDCENSAVLILGDTLYVGTGNGLNDRESLIAQKPDCPAVIALNKKTGAFIAGDDALIGHHLLHGSWSSPSYGEIDKRGLVFFGGGDGYCYAFDPIPSAPDADGKRYLHVVWKFDANPPAHRMMKTTWNDKKGRSEIIATPVFANNKVYTAIGQDPTHGLSYGRLSCIDAKKTGDITDTGLVWSCDKVNRILATPAVADGLVYVADLSGKIYCLNAETGEQYWMYDAHEKVMASLLVADNKLYVATDSGTVLILQASKVCKLLSKVKFPGQILSSTIAANGTLYIASYTTLYAFRLPSAVPAK
ncbi:MAG: PQQ-binding-like beta-propeller repeat protein [bacterium]